jgi:beta-lactamase regulating signal transducer with metallopeptidase domain
MALPYANPTPDLLLFFWIGGAILASVWYGMAYIRMRAFLHSAYPADAELQALFDTLLAQAGVQHKVQLLVSPALLSPVALLRRRICLPEYVVYALPTDQQRAMLAHELAHILRRDTFWLALAGWLRAVFFLQPLNIIAYRKLEETAEYLADSWAAEHTGKPLVLAECIVQVATTLISGLPISPGLVATRSFLGQRVRYLINRIEYPPMNRNNIFLAALLGSLLCSSMILIVLVYEDNPVQLAYQIPLIIWLIVVPMIYLRNTIDRVGRQLVQYGSSLFVIILASLLYISIALIVLVSEGHTGRLAYHIPCTIAPLFFWLAAVAIVRLRYVALKRG